MFGSVLRSLARSFTSECTLQRFIVCLTFLVFSPIQNAWSHFDENAKPIHNRPTLPVIRLLDHHHLHALHDVHRRSPRRLKQSSTSVASDELTSSKLWVIAGMLFGGMARPAISILAGVAMMAEPGPAAEPLFQKNFKSVFFNEIHSDSVFASFEPASFLNSVPIRLVSEEAKPGSSTKKHIVIADPAEFPRVKAFDHFDPGCLWDNMRPNLFGQEVTDDWDFYNLINTDRPDFTDATYSVGKGVTIIESGYTFRKSNADELTISRRQLPEVLTRIGITDEFELRIKWNGYVMTQISDQTTGLNTTSFGGDDLQLGFKYEVLQQNDWRPMVTFVGTAVLPTGTNGVSANVVQPSANMVLGWGFRRWLYLKASTGVDFVKSRDTTRIIDGTLQEGPLGLQAEDNSTQWHQSVSLLFQATKRVGGFIEWFCFFSDNASDNRPSHFADTGLFFYLTPNVQLDARIGTRLSDSVSTTFTGMGFSVRF